uniref:Uncharacterized protein n=1 Tax=Anopheles arabiensis TaxID=7173 RepID=A0A182IGX9_ANOAR
MLQCNKMLQMRPFSLKEAKDFPITFLHSNTTGWVQVESMLLVQE